jgi:hypothetical protein
VWDRPEAGVVTAGRHASEQREHQPHAATVATRTVAPPTARRRASVRFTSSTGIPQHSIGQELPKLPIFTGRRRGTHTSSWITGRKRCESRSGVSATFHIGLRPSNSRPPSRFRRDRARPCRPAGGQVAARVCPDVRPGVAVEDAFTVERPHVPSASDRWSRTPAALAPVHKASGMQLRGRCRTCRARRSLPQLAWLTDTAAIKAYGSTSRFRAARSGRRPLQLVMSQNAALSDVRKLAAKLSEQRAELREANRRMGSQTSTTQALEHAPTLRAAAPTVLQSLFDVIGWDMIALWWDAGDERTLECLAVVAAEGDARRLATATRRASNARVDGCGATSARSGSRTSARCGRRCPRCRAAPGSPRLQRPRTRGRRGAQCHQCRVASAAGRGGARSSTTWPQSSAVRARRAAGAPSCKPKKPPSRQAVRDPGQRAGSGRR